MLTRTEKSYLVLTLAFLAAGSGIKAWRHASVRLGPFPDLATLAQDSVRSADSLTQAGRGSDTGITDLAADTGRAALAADSGQRVFADRAEAAPLPSLEGPGEPASSAKKGPAETRGLPGPAQPINLNHADAAMLMRVNGIGAKTADAILAWRRAHGPFRSLRELLNIKGIGEKKLEKLSPHIIL